MSTLTCVETIIERINVDKTQLLNRDLLKVCQLAGDVLAGTINPHYCHEIAETALNLLIKRNYARDCLENSSAPTDKLNKIIKPLASRVPTQSWRSREQNALQQFSTPLAIAYLLTYLMNFQPGEVVLEPSAGTGSLAAWTSGIGLETHVNEIDPRRRELLQCVGFNPTAHNAEFINDLLAPEIKPDCVLMNPPFSANGERTKNNSSRFGFRHVASALDRLKPGGKFGVILGEAANFERATAQKFLSELADKFEFQAIIKMNGREYYKNGTTTDVNLIVGRKKFSREIMDWTQTRQKVTILQAGTVEDAFHQATHKNLRLI